MVKAWLQILGTNTKDSTPSILLFFDTKRYLFNVGEGFGRFAIQHRTPLKSIDHIFLTSNKWRSIGGLPGTILTISDLPSSTSVDITGPKNIDAFICSLRSFVQRSTRLNIRQLKNKKEPFLSGLLDYDSGQLRIQPVILSPSPSTFLLKEVVPPHFPNHLNEDKHETVDVPSQSPPEVKGQEYKQIGISMTSKNALKLNPKKVSVGDRTTICYICQIPDEVGKFDAEKAKALGLKPGPKNSILKSGKSVIADDGKTMIFPDQVVSPSKPGAIFVVMDIPSLDHLELVCQNRSWETYTAGGSKTNQVKYVLHITPSEVLNSQKYHQWMNSKFPQVQHVIINEVCHQNHVFENTAINSVLLNQIDPLVFPLQYSELGGSLSTTFGSNWIVANNLTKLPFYGNFEVDTSEELITHLPKFTYEGMIQNFETSLKRPIKQMIDDFKLNYQGEVKKPQLQVTFLGTGSASPSKYRNVSGIFVGLPEGGIILDCGEGTYGQLYRRFGAQLKEHLSTLKVIWVSHLHADHHSGLVRILMEHRNVMIEKNPIYYTPLIVIGPDGLSNYLSEFKNIEDIQYLFINSSHLKSKENELGKTINNLLGMKEFYNVRVIHRKDSYGLVMSHQSGWKLVYSGDTRPCPDLIEAGKGATVLIHEATFEDALYLDAKKKRHSTISEAVDSGVEMNAEHIILTHFSQRYPNFPVLPTEVKHKITVAFDQMTVNETDLKRTPKLHDLMNTLFPASDDKPVPVRDCEEEEEEEHEHTTGPTLKKPLKRENPESVGPPFTDRAKRGKSNEQPSEENKE
eukprot:TRINITY_DN9127_c0_g1_i1.p1 TRINITY_DN9127_c0_g1~~TRINITY_DN9127_c0_g1_i1.p1  ORF type:complete len:798 (+),score=134.97 TRINITY_DN9127_c0_g1_i1:235-2628(+)